MKRLLQLSALVAALTLAGACSDQQGPTTPDLGVSQPSEQVITCSVIVASGTMNCDSPDVSASRGMALNVTVMGAQNTYVTMASTGAAYSAGVFTANVTVQNRSAQIMGTANGTAPDANGIRVFFIAPPTVTTGTGTVVVTNGGDGNGTFTGANQVYYQYAGPLALNAISAPKAWSFTVPVTVTRFDFRVGVNTKVPDDAGVLRWIASSAGTSAPLDEIAEACNELWAVGGTSAVVGPPPIAATGVIQHYTGTVWAAQVNPVPNQVLHSVEMTCSGTTATGVAVGDNGTILYYNGTTWANVSLGGSGTLMSVSRAGTEWFACGLGGLIAHSNTGSTGWAQMTSNTTADLFVCGGPAANNVYAAGGTTGTPNTPFLTHWAGSAWSPTGYTSGFVNNIIRAAAGAGTEIWLIGDGGTITRSTDGLTFTAQTSGTTNILYGIEGFGAGVDLYAVGDHGTVLNYNGTNWTTQASGLGSTEILNDVVIRTTGTGGFTDAWAIGNAGVLIRGIQ